MFSLSALCAMLLAYIRSPFIYPACPAILSAIASGEGGSLSDGGSMLKVLSEVEGSKGRRTIH
jgi:hypothetical protein